MKIDLGPSVFLVIARSCIECGGDPESSGADEFRFVAAFDSRREAAAFAEVANEQVTELGGCCFEDGLIEYRRKIKACRDAAGDPGLHWDLIYCVVPAQRKISKANLKFSNDMNKPAAA